jgi:serine/threonine protein kinase
MRSGIMVDQGAYSLVQEYIQGTNLFDFMHKFNMKIPLPKQIMVAIQVSDAMQYLHR